MPAGEKTSLGDCIAIVHGIVRCVWLGVENDNLSVAKIFPNPLLKPLDVQQSWTCDMKSDRIFDNQHLNWMSWSISVYLTISETFRPDNVNQTQSEEGKWSAL